mmetsp:Transcript_59852/g.96931  ORF Transcript_59852/g.96931 Transcript_59852/m.96931 type:complete len:99 (+) Transcript_59852:1454-1750(+)
MLRTRLDSHGLPVDQTFSLSAPRQLRSSPCRGRRVSSTASSKRLAAVLRRLPKTEKGSGGVAPVCFCQLKCGSRGFSVAAQQRAWVATACGNCFALDV